MGVQGGPEYPGVSEGLVFCFDPANPNSCPSVSGNSTTVYNMVSNTSGSTSFANDEIPTEWAYARSNKGYIEFDGTDDYIEMEDNNTTLGLTGTNQMTAAWWGARQEPGVNYGSGFGAHNGGWDTGWGFWSPTVYSQINWEIKYYSSGHKANNPNYSSVDEWVLVTGTYDGSTLKLYVNGDSPNTNSTTQNILGDANIYIGRNSAATNYEFNGKIGPCMIWNRALSAAEVLKNYNALKERFGL